MRVYRAWVLQLRAEVDADPLDSAAVTRFFASLRARGLSPSSVHQAYRTVKTFCRWLLTTGAIERNPLVGFSIRTPTALPEVPTEDELPAVLACCPAGLVGTRNRAMILTMADAGLRVSEVVRLLVEHWNPQERSLFVRSGKGQKDRVTFIAPTTVRAIRDYLAARTQVSREDWLFVDARNRPLTPRHLVQILHRLSARAGLPPARRLHPHALRHFAATSWLRNGIGLDHVRRLLGHASLHMTLRYSTLTATDLQRAHKEAGAIERAALHSTERPRQRGRQRR